MRQDKQLQAMVNFLFTIYDVDSIDELMHILEEKEELLAVTAN